ncbi:MAG TPA: hypothetical protein VGJ26_08805 [Pirellulales bacterium]|jgi:uncharacterized repeat protein (TIGR01451 family)
MKRILVRLCALSAVASLGGFAIVSAKRGAATADSAAQTVAEQPDLQPVPQSAPVDNRYTQLETQASPAVDPFAAGQAPAPLADVGQAPPPVDPQEVPTADEASRRYQASRQVSAGDADPNVRKLQYDETAGAAPAAIAPMSDNSPVLNEPTLAPPRAGDRYAGSEPALLVAPDEPTAPPGDPFQKPQSAPPNNLEPLGAPAFNEQNRYQSDSNSAPQPLPDDGAFAPLAGGRDTAGAEGMGQPGQKHLEGQQAPAIIVEKVPPAEVQVGKPAVFVLKIRNVGSVPATQVEVHDQIPKGTQLLNTTPRAAQPTPGEVVWSLGTLKPKDEVKVELELMPTAEGEVGSVATVRFAAESSVRTMVTKPVLTIDVRSPKSVMLGEDVSIAIRVTNTGSGPATGVVLRNIVPETLQHPQGTELERELGVIRPKESREFDLTMRAVKQGRAVNTLTAIGEGKVRVDRQVDVEVVAPALLVKLDGPARRYLDRQATYTVSVSNPGTAAAKEVSLVAHMPNGMKFIEANNQGHYDAATRTVHWLLEELPPNETGAVTLTATPVEVGEQLMRIEGSAERGLSAQEEKAIVVEGVSAIFFEVVDVADPIEVGGEATYEVRVVNQGTKAATNVRVVALLPDELKPTVAEGPSRHTIDGQRVLFDSLAQLAPKAETTYRVKAKGMGPGEVRVRVQILTDEIRTPVTKEESTRVYADE